MSWRNLLQKDQSKQIIAPWVGDKALRTWSRSYNLIKKPEEYGWHIFNLTARDANWVEKISNVSDIIDDIVHNRINGYLVGDIFIPEAANATSKIEELRSNFKRAYLIDEGIDYFQRVSVGKFYEDSPLIYYGLEMGLGPEEEVLQAFLDRKESIDDIRGVVPALDVAFKIRSWNRKEIERIRLEEQKRQEEEERRRELRERFGDSIKRREMARADFGEAAKAALALSGATYLDHRNSGQPNEVIVRFRFRNQRFECVCDKNSLRIIDAGICLTQEFDSDIWDYGTKGDTWLTLESLPSTIDEAINLGKLVVFRHA